jgi:putative transcriptional regulator
MESIVRSEVRRLRLLQGELTQEELATRVGVTRQTIVAIEKGNYDPSVSLAIRIARVFDVTVEEIFLLEEPGRKRGAERRAGGRSRS